jgi:hypothetical protein
VRCGGGDHPRGHSGQGADNIVDNIGLPYSGINLAYSTSAPVGPGDADIFVNFPKKHHPTADYQRASCAPKLAATYPVGLSPSCRPTSSARS